MTMKLTRVDPAQLQAAIFKAVRDVERADQSLVELIRVYTPVERKAIPRARAKFEEAVPGLITVAKKRPAIAGRAASFDAAAVQEDMANVKALNPLEAALQMLMQRLSDARLGWTGEAWEPSVALYNEAKKERADGEVIQLIEPMKACLTEGRKPAMTEAEKAIAKNNKKKEQKIAKAKKVLADLGDQPK